MSGPENFFYDVPVYRLHEERYYQEMNKYIDSVLVPVGTPNREALLEEYRSEQGDKAWFRGHLSKSYGGMWRYNEIVGYIRLHFLGSQVRGEYYDVNKKRVVKTRRKVIEYRTWKLAPEREIWDSSSSESIYAVILKYLDDCRDELPRRYIDTKLFEKIGPFVNWKALFDRD